MEKKTTFGQWLDLIPVRNLTVSRSVREAMDDRPTRHGWLVAAFLALMLAACASVEPPRPLPQGLSATVADAVEIVAETDPDLARAHREQAVKPPGEGGVSHAVAIRLRRDLPVYRLWNGPAAVDAAGRTNRIGSWWTFDPPAGTVAAYRVAYEVCMSWNALAWLARCTLKAGAVVAVGPGQSVSAQTCGDPAGAEAYPPNLRAWQVFVDQPWVRGDELVCPPPLADTPVEPEDLTRPR